MDARLTAPLSATYDIFSEDNDEDSDDGSAEPFGGWDMVWPKDTADAPKTADTAPEPPRTPEQPTAPLSATYDIFSEDNDEDSDDGSAELSGGWDMVWPKDTADAPKAADTAPEPPRTPEQPTVAVSRATPSKDTPRELLDTRIVPRALWGVAGEGLQQEQALWVVAAHDAAALADALCGALGGQRMAAALLNWGRQTAKQPNSHANPSSQQADRDTHTVVHSLGQLPTHAVLMKRYLDLLAPPVQTAAATTQSQQAQRTSTDHSPATAARTTEDSNQHQQQQEPTA